MVDSVYIYTLKIGEEEIFMNKKISVFLMSMLIVLSLAMPAFATEAPNIDEIVAVEEVVRDADNSASAQAVESSREYTDRSFVDSLGKAMDLSTETKISSDFSKTANYYGSIIFQYLAIIVSVGTLLMIGIDMVFIMLPFSRSFLANGYEGRAVAGSNSQSGLGLASGMNEMHDMNSRNPLAGRGMMNYGNQLNQTPSSGRVQYVSNAALNALAAEKGNNKLALLEYIQNMSITIILSGVILVLAGTGILGSLGLAIGSKLTSLLKSLIFGLV